jgi:hypothetical protein
MNLYKSTVFRTLAVVGCLLLALAGCKSSPSAANQPPQPQHLSIDPSPAAGSGISAPTTVAPSPRPAGASPDMAAHHDVSPPLRDLQTLSPLAESSQGGSAEAEREREEEEEREREEREREERGGQPQLTVDRPGEPDADARPGSAPEDLEAEREREEHEQQARASSRPLVADRVVQQAGVTATPPAPVQNFDGVSNDGWGALDTNGDIGPDHYVQMINWKLQIWNKRTGASVYGPVDKRIIWGGMGEPCESAGVSDPVVVYDQLADRWLMLQLVDTDPGHGGGVCLMVSQNSDPTGAYYRYYFQLDGGFYDYPKLGVWPDGYYMTAHHNGQTIVAFERSKMLSGQDARTKEFDLPGTNTLTPADLDGLTPPPSGSPYYVGELNDATKSAVNIWRVYVDWTNLTAAHVDPAVSVSVAPFNYGTKVPQLNSVLLWNISDPMMFRLAYRNFGDHEMLLGTHAVNTGTSNAVRWHEFRNLSSTPTLYQEGTYAPDTATRFMPATAMDRQGNIMLAYSLTSSTTAPGVAYTGRLAGDTLGQMTQGEGILAAGSGSSDNERWGDYANMTVDPSDDCTLWFTTQYGQGTRAATRISALKFPSCTQNIARGKAATSSAVCATGSTPAQAVDEVNTTKWCSSATTKWLQVDLGAAYSLTGFTVKHAGAGGEGATLNTKDFNIQVSSNGTTWTTPVNVTGNTASVTSHTISATSARYVKLNVLTPSQSSDATARIYELEIAGTPVAPLPTATPTPTPSGLTNLALNKPITGTAGCAASEAAQYAVDGLSSTKWCSFDGNSWLQVDLGALYTVSNVVIKHAGAGGETTDFNTRDFTISLSSDGSDWRPGVTVAGNTASVTSHPLNGQAVRYVRLNVITPDQINDGAARIYELEVYGAATGVTPTATATPTRTPTPGTVTPTPTTTPTPTPGSSGLKVQYQVGDPSGANDGEVRPYVTLVNTSGSSVPLSELTIRYWYTRDTASAPVANCDYAVVGCANILTSFTTLATARSGADAYYQIGFTSGAGSLVSGASSEVKTRFHKTDWSTYSESGDYSYDPTKTAYTDWTKVTLYRNGVLVWGTEP